MGWSETIVRLGAKPGRIVVEVKEHEGKQFVALAFLASEGGRSISLRAEELPNLIIALGHAVEVIEKTTLVKRELEPASQRGHDPNIKLDGTIDDDKVFT